MSEIRMINELNNIATKLKKPMCIEYWRTYKGYEIYYQDARSKKEFSWERIGMGEFCLGWKINNNKGILMQTSEKTIMEESYTICFDIMAALNMSGQPINILLYFVQDNLALRLATEKLSEEEILRFNLNNLREFNSESNYEPVNLEMLKREYFYRTLGAAKSKLTGLNKKIEIPNPETCYKYLRSIFNRKFDAEFFGIITLNQEDHLTNTHIINIGAVTKEKVIMIIQAINYITIDMDKASKYIAFHIYPPEKIFPGFIDIDLAKILENLGRFKDKGQVPLVEYINIKKNSYVSFADNGLVRDEFEKFVERFKSTMEKHGIEGKLILNNE